jgi:RNA polymerase sigma factor (sigma-70 family)
VLQAREGGEQARRALEDLCRTYRAPVVAYVRRYTRQTDEAEDLGQAFFAAFIERAYHSRTDPARGSFRAYLLVTLKRFLNDASARKHAQKRGGGVKFQSLDDLDESDDPGAGAQTPDQAFQRDWAQAVLRAAMRRLQAETAAAGKSALFDALCEFLIERPSEADYEQIAAALKMRRNTVAVAVHRLRQRLHALVREELADTTADEAGLHGELDDLHPSLALALPAPAVDT